MAEDFSLLIGSPIGPPIRREDSQPIRMSQLRLLANQNEPADENMKKTLSRDEKETSKPCHPTYRQSHAIPPQIGPCHPTSERAMPSHLRKSHAIPPQLEPCHPTSVRAMRVAFGRIIRKCQFSPISAKMGAPEIS